MKVFVAEGIEPSGIDVFRSNGVELTEPETSPWEGADGIVIRSVFRIDAENLGDNPGLKVVGKLGTGLDNVDLDFCKSNQIEVVDARGLNAISTAEFMLVQMMDALKRTGEIYRRVAERDFRRKLYFGRELSGLTVGLVGYGNVGNTSPE